MPITKFRLRLLEDGRPQDVIARDVGTTKSRISEYALARRPIPMRRLYSFMALWDCDADDIIGFDYDDIDVDDDTEPDYHVFPRPRPPRR